MKPCNARWLGQQMLGTVWVEPEGETWKVTAYDIIRPSIVRLEDVADTTRLRAGTIEYLLDQCEVHT